MQPPPTPTADPAGPVPGVGQMAVPLAAAQHPPAPAVLALEGITKSFPGVQALRGVSFDVRPGEVHALLGENGAGKSTLIKIMSGVHQADAGVLRLDGRPIRLPSPHAARQAGIATIYQELLLFPELTVAENIFMGHAPRTRWGGLDWPAMRSAAARLFAELDITDLDAAQVVGALSVGNRQRVEILRALSQDARILIMDEPTAALTGHDVARLFAIVRRLRDRGVSIIYISHRLEEIFTIADRVTVLRDGEHVATRPVAATDHAGLIEMMVGRRIDSLFPRIEVTPGAAVLELRGLARPPVTHDVSLTVRAGEIVGLAGLVGSGRSELALAIFGVTPATAGSILVDGTIAQVDSVADARRLGIAYVPEDRATQGLVRPMTVRENASLAVLAEVAHFGFIDRDAETRLADDVVARFGVRTAGIEQVAGKLSGGNQQKIVLGKWLATQPKVLILDEPTRGIDVGAKAEIHRLMSELAGRGMAVLMISSELPEVLGMSDRILVMRDGRIVAAFARAGATQQKVATAMMGGG